MQCAHTLPVVVILLVVPSPTYQLLACLKLYANVLTGFRSPPVLYGYFPHTDPKMKVTSTLHQSLIWEKSESCVGLGLGRDCSTNGGDTVGSEA